MEKSAKSAPPEKERRMTQKLRGFSADLNRFQVLYHSKQIVHSQLRETSNTPH